MSNSPSVATIPNMELPSLSRIGASINLSVCSDTLWKRLVIVVAIVSNAALLIAQQIAFRLLAPLIGSSIETWSTIIGVFLFGIAIGNRVAGKLTDRYSPNSLIVTSLVMGAISMLSMPWLVDMLLRSEAFIGLSLNIQVLAASTIVCLLPGIALSLATPPSIRSVVTRSDEVGAASGKIFAFGTFGSLFGNYLAGFVLIALLGVRTIVHVTSCSLILLSVITWILGRNRTTGIGVRSASTQADQDADRDVFAATSDEAPDATRSWYTCALITVFACSFASGAVEGAAFRILAPLVGVSMFLSAGVVGVILAGMSLGNALGGWLATRFATRDALRLSLAACAAAVLAIAPIWKNAMGTGVFSELSLIPQIVIWSFVLFFLPALALGTVTPQVIQLSVRDVRRTGVIAGQLYAWSTVGCIAGIMMGSWFMIETFGAIHTSILCGVVPIVLMWWIGKFESKAAQRWNRYRCYLLLGCAAFLLLACKSPYDRESKYYALRVFDQVIEDRKVKVLSLDKLKHSVVDINDPNYLHYPHEYIQGDFTRAAASAARARGRKPRILVIGGGGYTFPRWVEAQRDLNDVHIDVVEIDPAVTEISYDLLGLSRSTRIVSIHMDGRQFVKSASESSYDLVIQDAVNDFSVPYHLMTTEYNVLIKRLLRPDGVYLLTIIDAIESGRFMASAVRTMRTAFGEARLLVPARLAAVQSRQVFIIGARAMCETSGVMVDREDTTWWSDRSPDQAKIFSAAEIHKILERRGTSSPVLTDDYAPVDILMASQVLKR